MFQLIIRTSVYTLIFCLILLLFIAVFCRPILLYTFSDCRDAV